MNCENCKNKIDKRTHQQNNALHLLFKQISDECMEKGIDMRAIVREEVPIQCTPENIKWLWKLIQEHLFKKRRTRDLKKTGEIEVVYDTFNKILIDRTKGEISLPPFPSMELFGERLEKAVELPKKKNKLTTKKWNRKN